MSNEKIANRDLFWKALEIARSEKGWTYTRIAKEAGINNKYLTIVKRGDRNPKAETQEKIAAAFGYQLLDFIALGRSPGPPPAGQPPVTIPSPGNDLEQLRRKNDDLTDALLKAIAKWEGLSDEMLIKDARIKAKDRIIDGKNEVIKQLSEANGKLVDILKEAGEEDRIPPDLIYSAVVSLAEAGNLAR